MYSVTYGGELIYRSGSAGLTASGLCLSEKEGRPAEFSFEVPETNPYAGKMESGRGEIVVYDSIDGILADRNEIFRGKITNIEEDFYGGRNIECKGSMAYLSGSIQRPSEHHNKTAAQFLAYLLDRHNEQAQEEERMYLGAVTVHDSNDSIYRYTNYETTLECIQEKLVDILGGRIVVRRDGGKNYLDYLAEYMNTNSQPIEFGKNLLDFSKAMDASGIYTVCIPLGARQEESPIEALDAYLTIGSVNNGKDYVENQGAIALYGRRTKVVSFRDVTVPANLKRKGEEWLRENQYENLSLKVTAIDLSMAEKEFESFKLGDETLVRSLPHGLNRRFPITERERYLDSPEKNTITLGKGVAGGIVGGIQSGQERAKEQFSKILSNNQLLSIAKNTATQLINAATNGYIVTTKDEILIMDTPSKETAAKVWRWNINGLGYSNTGYAGPYKTAMTMDGAFVADFITAGILSGIIIRSVAGVGMLEINGARMNFSYNGKQFGYISPYASLGTTPSELEIGEMSIGLSADERSNGIAMYSKAVEGNDYHYPIARFKCRDGDGKKPHAEFYGTVDFKSRINLRASDGEYQGSLAMGADESIYLVGKNKAVLGYSDGEESGYGTLIEVSAAWSDYRARVYGGLRITGNMAATGTKNRIVDIGDKKVLMNAYETADCLFGDSGSGVFDSCGELPVNLDETFRRTIEGDYSIFAYGYSGAVTVKEKHRTGFTLDGKPGSRVDYEIRAKQKGYADVRLQEFKEDEDGGH